MIENWIVPCNVKFFDVVSYFKNHSEIIWRKGPSIHVGDMVYVYVGAPYSQIKFKCEVLQVSIDKETLENNSYAIKNDNYKANNYMRLKLINEIPDGQLKYIELKQHGLGQVQTQARTDRKLQAYLDEME